MDTQHTTPNALDSERYVLGACLQDYQAVNSCVQVIKEGDFYHNQNNLIWESVLRLSKANQPVDFSTVSDVLSSIQKLAEAGGREYLAELIEETPGTASAEYHAQRVRDKSLLRNLIKESSTIIGNAHQLEDALEAINDAERRISMLAQTRSNKTIKKMDNVFDELMKRVIAIKAGEFTGLPTGFTHLDRLTSGLQGGELIILAGRPGMGKTAFALSLVRNVTLEKGLKCAFFSLEMGAEQLVQRMLASFARVDMYKLKSGTLSKDDYQNIHLVTPAIQKAHLYIDDISPLTLIELKSKCRQLENQLRGPGGEKGLDLIVIDYLQLMSGNTKESRQVEVAQISRGLKELAKELRVPVIALSQLSRKVEERGNEGDQKRPMLSDLRESGSIEQDADMVWFVYRDAYYNKEKRGDERQHAELIVAKHRNGELDDIKLDFVGKHAAFYDRMEEADFE